MVAWLAAAAPIIGAAVDVLSGERSARKTRKHTRGVATDEAFGSVAGRVEAAKAAGLHPLAALGTPSSSGMSVGGGMTDFRAAMTDAANSYSQQRQWKAEREFQEASARDARSAAHNAELRESARLRTEQAMAAKQMQFIDEQIRASQEESIRRNLNATKAVPVPRVVARSTEKPIPDMYVPVRDRQGKIQYVPNPDIYDLETSALVGSGTLVLPEIKNSGWWQKLKEKKAQWDQQGRELRALDPRQNPYRLPTPIGD